MDATELQIAQLAEGPLAFAETGSGTPLVFLHGIGSSARSWQSVFAHLPKGFHALAWNAPGYPPSAPLRQDAPTATDYAERLKDFLDARKLERVHLIGHSLGCLMAARFARLYPERVASLTLASCALGHARLPQSERERLLTSRLGDVEELGARGMAQKRGPRLLGPGASDALIQSVVAQMASIDPRGYAQGAHMLSSGDLLTDIAALPASLPIQFIYGSGDVITPPEANLRAAALRPTAPVSVLEGAGHACYVEQPHAFITAIKGLVSPHA